MSHLLITFQRGPYKFGCINALRISGVGLL